MKTKSGLVDSTHAEIMRRIGFDWVGTSYAPRGPITSLFARPSFNSDSLTIEPKAIYSNYHAAAEAVKPRRSPYRTSSTLASSEITYETNRPNKSNYCVKRPSGVGLYEPYPARAVVWPEPSIMISSAGFRPIQTMYRAAVLRGYPQCDDRNIVYNKVPVNEPSTHRIAITGRSLAAGPLSGLDALLTSIIEAKDIPATLRGILQFAKFVYRIGRRRTQVLSKTTVREVTAAYLNVTYGVCPTLRDIERFITSLPDELVKARTHLDAMFEASANSIRKSRRDYQRWLRAREKRDAEVAIQREQRKRERDAERELRRLERERRKARIASLKEFRESLKRDRDALRASIYSDIDKARAQLYSEYAGILAFKEELDELFNERQGQLDKFFTDAAALIKDREKLYIELRHLQCLNRSGMDRFYVTDDIEDKIYAAKMKLDTISQERKAFLSDVAAAKQKILDELEDAYARRNDIYEYLSTLHRVLSDTSHFNSEIDSVNYEIDRLYEEAEKARKAAQRRRSRTLSTGSTKLTREYRFPDLYVSARKMLYSEPGGARYTTTIPTETRQYDITYRLHDWSIEPDFSDAISGIVKDAVSHLFRGEMRTICSKALVYKQWPLEFLTGYFTPFGRLCDFVHSYIQPFQTIWAIVPWSFCIDWVSDFSATFEALEAEFTRRALGLPEVPTWAALTYRALLATNLDSPIPVHIEQEWLSDPGAIAHEHTVRYTIKLGSHFSMWGLASEAFVRRVEQSTGVSEFLPPVSLQNVLDHSIEGLALLTQQLIK